MSDDHGELLRFEYNFVVAVIHDLLFRRYVVDIIEPEFIMDLDYRYIYQTVIKMMRRNHPVIFMSVVETIRLDTSLSEDKVKAYEDILIPLSRGEMKLIVENALSYVLPRIEEEVSKSVLYRAFAKGSSLLDGGNYKEVFALFRQLEGQTIFRKPSVSAFFSDNDEDEAMSLKRDLEGTGIPLGIRGVANNGAAASVDDDLFYKGVGRGHVAIIACETKLGKTTMLLNVAIFQILSGYNVDFYSLETDVNYLKYRSCSIITKRTTDSLRGDLEGATKKMKSILKKYPNRGSSRFYRYTAGELTSSIIASNTVQARKEGRNVDVVIVDYTDLMAAQGQREDDISKVKRLSNELGAVAVENNFALITASQVGRQAFGKKDVGAGDVTGSIARIFSCDIFLLMYQEQEIIPNPSGEDTVISKVKIRQDRTRYGRSGKTILLDVNKETGRMFDVLP